MIPWLVAYVDSVKFDMTEFILAQEIESDLRLIINEAHSKKSIPHVKDRAERAVASMLTITDHASLDRAIGEVLSTLLITTEVGSVPKLILLSLNILQKLASSNVIHSETFLHMVTVLCKATSSVTSVIGSTVSGAPTAVEIELAQVRCLQTLHLLQVKELAPYFLDEIALSQIISMCTNLVNNSSSSPVLVQTASAAISQLQIFVTETTEELTRSQSNANMASVPALAILNAQGELNGVAHAVDAEGLGACKCLFFLMHDLVTMSSPSETRSVFCTLFGSSRLKPQLAIEILSETMSQNEFWIKNVAFIQIINYYILPMISKTVSNVKISDSRIFLKLFARIASNPVLFKTTAHELNKIFTQLHNGIVDADLDEPRRVLFTEAITTAVFSNPVAVYASLESALLSSRSPLGGDSPVRSSGRTVAISSTIAESLIDSMCVYIHHATGNETRIVSELPKLNLRTISETSGSAAFTLLNTVTTTIPAEILSSLTAVHTVGLSVELLLTFIDLVYKQEVMGSRGVTKNSPILTTWASILSCLIFIAGYADSDISTTIPGVLSGIEKIIWILCVHRCEEGIVSCINAIIKLRNINRSLVVIFTRLSSDERTLSAISVEMWRTILRLVETMHYASPSEESAVEALFTSSLSATKIFVSAILPPPGNAPSLTVWEMRRLTQLLTSPQGAAQILNLWQEFVSPCLCAYFNDEMTDAPRAAKPTSTVAAAIVDVVAAVAMATVHTDEAQALVLACLKPIVGICPSEISERLLAVIESSGHLLTSAGWNESVEVLSMLSESGKTAPLQTEFKICEIIIEEFLILEKIKFSTIINVLTKTCIVQDLLPVTSAFKGIALILKVAEAASRSLVARDQTVTAIENFFMASSTNSRSEVRNCAIKTLGSVPSSILGLEHALRIANCISLTAAAASTMTTPRTPAPEIVVHHSRDTEEKRWSETIVLMMRVIVPALRQTGNIVSSLGSAGMETWMSTCMAASEAEVVEATNKALVEMWKMVSFEPVSLFLKLIQAETIKAESAPSLPISVTFLVPLLLTSVSQTSLSPEVSVQIFRLFAAAITHPSLYLSIAVPFPVHHLKSSDSRKNFSSPWTRLAWETSTYSKETEAYKSVAVRTTGDAVYGLNPDSLKIVDAFTSQLVAALFPLETEKLIDLLLEPEFVFRDSVSLAIALRVIEMLLTKHGEFNPETLSHFVMALSRLGDSRNAGVAISSCDIWKLCGQALINIGTDDAKKETVRLITSTNFFTRLVDPIDFVMFAYAFAEDDALMTVWINQSLAQLAEQVANDTDKNMLYFFVLMRILRGDPCDPSPWRLATANHLSVTSDELLKGPIPIYHESIVTAICAFFRKPDTHPGVVCDLLAVITHAVAGNHAEALRIVKDVWDVMADFLIVCDSSAVRAKTSHLMLAIGPFIKSVV